MREPTVIPPGGGEVIGDAADRRVEILSDHEALHATWSRFGPCRDGAEARVALESRQPRIRAIGGQVGEHDPLEEVAPLRDRGDGAADAAGADDEDPHW